MKKVLIFTNQLLYRYHNAALAAQMYPTISDKLNNLNNYDALLLPGGEDIEPSLYGQDNFASRGIDRQLDEKSIEAFLHFFHHEKPVLGICKGLQIINVALKGTLIQDIPNHMCTDNHNAHIVKMKAKNYFFDKYPSDFYVNSFHHQAIDVLGKDLFITFTAPDGIIEGIQHKIRPVAAVQWHPERLKGGMKIFQTFNNLI